MSDWATGYPRQVGYRITNDLSAAVSFPEAPSDGKYYARRNAAWADTATLIASSSIAGDVTGSLAASIVSRALGGVYFFGGSAANTSLSLTRPAAVSDAVASNSHTAFGSEVLQSVTTATSNSGFGRLALSAATTGSENCAFGYGALAGLTTAWANTAVGKDAGRNANANQGTYVGYEAGTTTTTYGDFFGYQCGRNQTTGTDNSAFGNRALQTLTTGYQNCVFGVFAGNSMTTAHDNTCMGWSAGLTVTSNGNSFFGSGAGRSATATAGECCYFGFECGRLATTGLNTAYGAYALWKLTTGSTNTAVGYSAGYNITTATDNVYVGDNAYTGAAGNENVMIGVNAGMSFAGGNRNVLIGKRVTGDGAAHTGSANVCIGYDITLGTTNPTSNNIMLGNSLSRPNVAFPVFQVPLGSVPTYADDAAAGAGGLTAGCIYKTAAGVMGIKL